MPGLWSCCDRLKHHSFLSNFIQLDLLRLLRQILGNIAIPEAVATELDQAGDLLGDWLRLSKDFIHITPCERNLLTDQLLIRLHLGEAEAIVLAIQHKAKLLLCDDLDARRLALYHGLKVTGTLGILLRAGSPGFSPPSPHSLINCAQKFDSGLPMSFMSNCSPLQVNCNNMVPQVLQGDFHLPSERI